MPTFNGTNNNDLFNTDLISSNEPWTIYGNGGNDTLTGSYLNDTIYGGEGNDLIDGSYGSDILVGGNGIDTVTYNFYSGPINANLATGTVTFFGVAGIDSLGSIENLIGGGGNDKITGSDGDNVLRGGNGNDSIYGGFGNDSIYGDGGDDFLDGGFGFDSIDGGAGIDTVTYDFYGWGINANLTTGVVTFPGNGNLADTLKGIENIIGSSGDDSITGNSLNNYISGGYGNDTLNGGGGNDTLDGNAGNNLLNGGAGNDTFFVNSAGDLVVETPNSGTDTVYSAVDYTLTANVENLSIYGNASTAIGNDLNNVIKGNNGKGNIINGGGGNDTITGGIGHDYITGGSGNDVLNAYAGGYEVDDLSGGAGADKFILGDTSQVYYTYPGLPAGNYDYAVIADFKVSEGDKVQLRGNAGNYFLGINTGGGYGTAAADTLIYSNNGGSIGSGNLVAILADVSTLSLTGSSFTYV
ncbi:MAG: hypothetical protein N5P05_002935 [Chroococcopsis gigantea SAG 12.99]|jgi:Ca2+-binding RTX toxin-like protein|nr:hypothetical protein [Chlorogloea purpurea SAG 13.99]MDV3001329.1 hypothetical protein [Chroococcopsis gigantea SAG 12.99]